MSLSLLTIGSNRCKIISLKYRDEVSRQEKGTVEEYREKIRQFKDFYRFGKFPGKKKLLPLSYHTTEFGY